MPFYKDSYTHGNLYFEFLVTFPPPKSISSDCEQALRKVFDYKVTNEGLDKKPKAVPLDEYSEELLNHRPHKHEPEEDEDEGQPRGVQCQSQ